jgi:hypothetical protein
MGADDHCYRPRTPMVLERVRDKTGEALAEAHRTNLLRIMIADPARIDALAIAIQDWNASHARLDSPALIAQRPLAPRRHRREEQPARLELGGPDAPGVCH